MGTRRVEEESERLKEKRLREERETMRERPKPPREQLELPPKKPADLTDFTFTEAVQKHPLVVVDCWADWCFPCKIIEPVIEELSKEYSGKVIFGKLNVDENRAIAMKFMIQSIPTLLIFKQGKLVDRIIGAVPKEHIDGKIKQHAV